MHMDMVRFSIHHSLTHSLTLVACGEEGDNGWSSVDTFVLYSQGRCCRIHIRSSEAYNEDIPQETPSDQPYRRVVKDTLYVEVRSVGKT